MYRPSPVPPLDLETNFVKSIGRISGCILHRYLYSNHDLASALSNSNFDGPFLHEFLGVVQKIGNDLDYSYFVCVHDLLIS